MLSIFISVFLSVIFLSLASCFNYCFYFDLVNLNSLSVLNYFVYLDWYTLFFFSVLFSIVFSIYSFITYYFSIEINLSRFVSLLNLFIVSMVFLVMSPGLVSLLLGWDGLGFISFLLVCWFGSSQSFSASLKTFLVNRFGDSLLLCGLTLLFFCGGFDYYYSFILFIFLALLTKSALYPFSYWLPEAMAAPTPVSALVHSSTLVVAGLYILFRYFFLLSYLVLFFLSCIGLLTLFYGSYQASVTYDSKKLVAYSTLSQLGFLAFFLGLGFLDLFYHYLLVHAVFKASLFVSVGSYMVVGSHNQDVRYLSSLWFLNPIISVIFFLSIFSLSGFPFLSCFFFKELLIGSALNINFGLFFLFLFISSLLLTVYYSFRLLFIFIFNKFVLINSYLNLNYSVVSSVLFSFLMLLVGVCFSFGYCFWLNVGSSFSLFTLYSLVVLLCNYGLLYFVNFNSLLLNAFCSFFSYSYIYLFSISYVFDLNVFVFGFISFISFFYLALSRISTQFFLLSLVYLLLFSIFVSVLVFII
uniref:NADH:ubiquinone reductase (H(+)-translocating) n=2 Tax=Girardia TaxID=52316 RepID=A0A0C4ZKM0_9PLAT|nr:NADH dehydrogenase subunit 5 [Girardia sp. ER-2015]QWT28935.1 NADH dehydrogenase subunit 5 [Girardia tigrina]